MFLELLVSILVSGEIPPSVTCTYASKGDLRIATCVVNHEAGKQRFDLFNDPKNADQDSIIQIATEKYPIEKWVFEDAVNNPGFLRYEILVKEVTMPCEDEFGRPFGRIQRDVAKLVFHQTLINYFKKFKYPKFEGYASESSGEIKLVDLQILSKNDRWPYTYSQKGLSISMALGAIDYFHGYCGRSWPPLN
jgi:hypothetical protein